MNLRAKAASGLKWQAVEIAGRQLLSLVVFTTLARLLDPSAFGLVAMVGVYLAFVTMFAEQGLGTALIQRKDIEPQHLHTAFWFVNLAGLLVFALSQVLAPWVARLMAEPQLVPLIRWASAALLFGSLTSVHSALFLREMDFRRPAIRTLLANLAGGVVGIGLALGDYGVWALVFQQLTAAAVGAAFIWAVSSYRPKLVFSFTHLRDLIGMSAAVFGSSLLWFISSRADQFFIGRFLGAGSLGFYSVAQRLPDLARNAIAQPIAAVSLPALSRMQGNHERLAKAVYAGMVPVAVVGFPVFLGLAAAAPVLVPLVFGPKWEPSVVLLQLLSIYTLANFLQIFFHPLLIATGGAGSYILLNVLHAAGTVSACFLGAYWGAPWLLAGLILNTSFVAVLAFAYLVRRVRLSWLSYWRPCLIPAVAGSLMAVAVVLLGSLAKNLGLLPTAALQIALGVGIYAGVVYFFSRDTVSVLRAMIGGHRPTATVSA
jgi:O-antigen/teichoic acid export membrane protein